MSHPVDHLIVAWLIDDLDASGVKALEEALRTDRTARARFARFCQSESILPQALWLAPMRPAITGTRLPLTNGQRTWVLSAAAAALVAVIVLVTLISLPTAKPSSVSTPLIAYNGPLELLRADGKVQVAGKLLAAGQTAPRGAVVEIVNGSAEFRWRDGSHLIATNGTTLRVADEFVAVQVIIGRLDAHVTKQTSTPFVIGSAHATTTVMGTRFSLVVSAERTELAVSEGRVNFISAAKGASRQVIAGESVIADAEGLHSAINPRILGFVLTASDINKVLGDRMVGRASLRLSELPGDGINLRIECTPEVLAVRTGMRGVDERLEQERAFYVFGNNGNRSYISWKPGLGTFLIDVQPFFDVAGTAPAGPPMVFELTILP